MGRLFGKMYVLGTLVVSVLFFLPSCGEVAQVAGPIDKGADTYHRRVEAQTRDARLYDRFDTRALIEATLLSDAFLSTWCREYARVHHLEVPADRPCQEARARFGDGVPVVVHLETPDPARGNLDAPQAIWSITLFNDVGVSVTPYQVERVLPVTVEDLYFFPYAGSFGKTYLLKFPRRPGWKPTEVDTDGGMPKRSGGDTQAAPGEGTGRVPPDEARAEGSATGGVTGTGAPARDGGPPAGCEVLDGHRVTLRLAGVLGTAELVWDLE